MPINYSIDKDLGVVFSSWHGVVADSEVIEFSRKLYNDPEFHPDFRNLADLRQLTGDKMTGHSVRAIAASSRFSVKARRAIVVSRDLEYGFSRMYQTEAEFHRGAAPQVFRNLSEALAWLNQGVPPDKHIV